MPNEHTKKFEKEEISLISFLKSTEFMDLDYKPIIDFTTDELIISKDKRIRGFTFKENYLNMAKPFNHDVITGNPIQQTPELKQNINLIYKHIKEVLCNNETKSYEYVLNFIACSFGGRKLRKALLLQSKERTGKGMIINDVLKKILGDRMCKTNSTESILKFTKTFEGCCLLNFDELPHCDNYKGLQDCLKGLITEPKFACRDMWSTGYEQDNTFNIMITTNNDAINLTQNNNTKYICLDINESRIGDHEYFDALKAAIKSNYVLEQFYNEMVKRFKTLDNWNEDYAPLTNTTKVKIIEALPRLYKYIKEQFVLPQLDIDVNMKEFLTEYIFITKDRTSPNKIGRMLKEIGIESKKINNKEGYKYIKSAKELLEVYKNKNWLDDLIDKVDEDDEDDEKPSNIKSPLDNGVEFSDMEDDVRVVKSTNQVSKPDVNIADDNIADDNIDDDNIDDDDIDTIMAELDKIHANKKKYIKKK